MQYMKTKKGTPHIKYLSVGRLSMGYLKLNINSNHFMSKSNHLKEFFTNLIIYGDGQNNGYC